MIRLQFGPQQQKSFILSKIYENPICTFTQKNHKEDVGRFYLNVFLLLKIIKTLKKEKPSVDLEGIRRIIIFIHKYSIGYLNPHVLFAGFTIWMLDRLWQTDVVHEPALSMDCRYFVNLIWIFIMKYHSNLHSIQSEE